MNPYPLHYGRKDLSCGAHYDLRPYRLKLIFPALKEEPHVRIISQTLDATQFLKALNALPDPFDLIVLLDSRIALSNDLYLASELCEKTPRSNGSACRTFSNCSIMNASPFRRNIISLC